MVPVAESVYRLRFHQVGSGEKGGGGGVPEGGCPNSVSLDIGYGTVMY